jgi:hypothetical protein
MLTSSIATEYMQIKQDLRRTSNRRVGTAQPTTANSVSTSKLRKSYVHKNRPLLIPNS